MTTKTNYTKLYQDAFVRIVCGESIAEFLAIQARQRAEAVAEVERVKRVSATAELAAQREADRKERARLEREARNADALRAWITTLRTPVGKRPGVYRAVRTTSVHAVLPND